jgi:Xaa-Pro dipeptidase
MALTQPDEMGELWAPITQRLCNIDKLIETMDERGLDGVMLRTRRNVFYLSTFWQNSYAEAEYSSGAAVIISRSAPEHPILIIPDVYLGYLLNQDTWIEDIRTFRYSTFTAPDLPLEAQGLDRFMPNVATETAWYKRANAAYALNFADASGRALKDLGLGRGKRIGIDDLRDARYIEAVESTSVDCLSMMLGVRYYKTPVELQLIRRGAKISALSQEHMARSWRNGMTWRETQQYYVEEATRLGAYASTPDVRGIATPAARSIDNGYETGRGFAGFNGAAPDFVLRPGTNMMTDMHGIYNAYAMDGGKTWRVGEPSPSGGARKRLERCAEAFRAMNDACQPGVRPRDIQPIVRQILKKHGIAEADGALIFFHSLGMSHVDIDLELWGSTVDWRMQQGGVVATHLFVPAEMPEDRVYFEDIVDVKPGGWDGDGYFGWDYIDWR